MSNLQQMQIFKPLAMFNYEPNGVFVTAQTDLISQCPQCHLNGLFCQNNSPKIREEKVINLLFLSTTLTSSPSNSKHFSFLQVQQTMKENLVAVEENFSALDQRMKKLSK